MTGQEQSPIALVNSIQGPGSESNPRTETPNSPAELFDSSQSERHLNDNGPAIMPLPAAEPLPIDSPAARMPGDVIHMILGSHILGIQDFGSIEQAGISLDWSAFAREETLRQFENTTIALRTAFQVDNEVEEESENLYPVFKKLPLGDRVLPDNRVVFEPESFDGHRYCYPRAHYHPVDVFMFDLPCRRRTYHWQLGEENERNTQNFREDRYFIFHYYHECDIWRKFSMKVWYKFDGNKMRLHCVSIPLQLLLMIVKEAH